MRRQNLLQVRLVSVEASKTECCPELLGNHAALLCLLPHQRSYLHKALALVGTGTRVVKASAAEVYAQSVCSRVAELDNGLLSLRLVQRFAGALANDSDPDPDIYRYQYENFVFRCIGHVDRAHLLVAAALLMSKKRGKMPDNHLIEGQVKNRNAGVHAALLEVKSTVQFYRRPRNELVHASAYSCRDFGVLGGVLYLDLNVEGVDIEAVARALFSEGSNEIATTLEVLSLKLGALLEALRPMFELVAKAATKKAASKEAVE